MQVVVLDACVLFSPSIRDLLLYIAQVGLIRPRWSDMIHEEWIHAVLRSRPDIGRKKLEETRQTMDEYFRDSLIAGFEHLIPNMQLPDEKDRHVLALAIHTKAALIVTDNLRDFPDARLAKHNMEALDVNRFLSRLVLTQPDKLLAAVALHRGELCNPPKSAEEYIATFEQHGFTFFTAFLREHITEI